MLFMNSGNHAIILNSKEQKSSCRIRHTYNFFYQIVIRITFQITFELSIQSLLFGNCTHFNPS